MTDNRKKLVPIIVSESWKEWFDNPSPEALAYFKNKTVKLTSTNGIDETIAEKLDEKYQKGA